METTPFRRAVEAHRAGRLDEAETAYRAALKAGEQPGPAAYNLGNILNQRFRFEEALEHLRLALRLQPEGPNSLSAMGRAFLGLHDPISAEAALRRSLELDPGNDLVRMRLSWSLLMQGRYLEAWPFWEHRPSRLDNRILRARFPEWRGEPLRGRSILVWGEQGLGDEIQAARFLPWLREHGPRRITLASLSANVRVLAQTGADQVVSREGPVSGAGFDFWVLIWSLPGRLGVTYDTVPGAPYLRPPNVVRTGGVGFAWAGNPANPNDLERSVPPEQRGPPIPRGVELRPAGDMLDSLERIAALDEVVAVDTSWAHLAGAMGLPVRLLLSHAGQDWRWMPPGDSSPWYPSARIYRQPTPGEWGSVLTRLRQDLAAPSRG
jgi:hypothetical protein